jgi:hypothetical protein
MKSKSLSNNHIGKMFSIDHEFVFTYKTTALAKENLRITNLWTSLHGLSAVGMPCEPKTQFDFSAEDVVKFFKSELEEQNEQEGLEIDVGYINPKEIFILLEFEKYVFVDRHDGEEQFILANILFGAKTRWIILDSFVDLTKH